MGGVLGAGNDASHVYFFSAEALGGKGRPGNGTCISTTAGRRLRGDSRRLVRRFQERRTALGRRTSRVSPDGLGLAFMSTASLTGYDNIDADQRRSRRRGLPLRRRRQRSAELRLLQPERGAAGRPRPSAPTAETAVAAQLPRLSNQLYAPRVISDDGTRVFFDSFDSLRPARHQRQAGRLRVGGRASGRLQQRRAELRPRRRRLPQPDLLRREPQDSEFLDASADGSDVFFATALEPAAPGPGPDRHLRRPRRRRPPEPAGPAAGLRRRSLPEPAGAAQRPDPASSSAFVGPANPVPKKPAAKRKQKGKKHNQKKQKKNKKRNGEKQGKSGKGSR